MSTGNCPTCGFAGTPEEMWDHFAHGLVGAHDVGHWERGKAFAEAAGVRDYEAGFPRTSGTFDVGGLKVKILPAVRGGTVRWGDRSRPRKSSRPRTYVVCPRCTLEVPAGRVAQHKCSSSLTRRRLRRRS